MEVENNIPERLNSFALVAYVPDPLGAYLDDVRRELVPGCNPHAHVTILPPRPLPVSPEQAWEFISSRLKDFPPFEVESGSVEIFGLTSVVYVGLRQGDRQFREMHQLLNAGPLEFQEPYPFHPHITLAQDLACEDVPGAYEAARRIWAGIPHERRFPVESITFVQNTGQNRWLDLARCSLGEVAAVR